MTTLPLTGFTVEITRPVKTLDRYNDSVDSDDPPVVVYSGECHAQQASSQKTWVSAEARTMSSAVWHFWIDGIVDVREFDLVSFDGLDLALQGRPTQWDVEEIGVTYTEFFAYVQRG